jgi:type VI protein secretion system component VasK
MTSVRIELSNDEAMVLHSWVARFNQREDNQFEDQAEQRVLWNLEALLEKSQADPFLEEYDSLVASARARVRDHKH